MWGSKAHEFALVSWQSDLNPIWGQKIEGLVAKFENISCIEWPFLRAGLQLKLKGSAKLLEINRFPVYNFSMIQKLYRGYLAPFR